MKRKPSIRGEQGEEQLNLVKGCCLHVAKVLGPLMDQLTVVGGLVPYFLIPPEKLPQGVQHSATMDLDLGLTLGSEGARCYHDITGKLRDAGFVADDDAKGQAGFRWKYLSGGAAKVWVDLILAEEVDGIRPWLPEVSCALRDRERVAVSGKTVRGEEGSSTLWVCCAAPFLLLKAIAFRRRQEPKDAHDLYFMLRYYHGDLLSPLARLVREREGAIFLQVLEECFRESDDTGPTAVARFLLGRLDDAVQADVAGEARRVLSLFHVR